LSSGLKHTLLTSLNCTLRDSLTLFSH
jgi:hypothetical protein